MLLPSFASLQLLAVCLGLIVGLSFAPFANAQSPSGTGGLNGGSGFVGSVAILAGRFGGYGVSGGYTPTPASTALFTGPTSVAGDPTYSSVFVSDGQTIRNITGGFIRTIAGQSSNGGYVDGPVASALLAIPTGLRMLKRSEDAQKALYFCDTGNNVIRKLSNGIVSTVSGSRTGVAGYANGTNPTFNKPSGLDMGPDGALYVADTSNNAIRRIAPITGDTTTVYGRPLLQPRTVRNSNDDQYLAISGVIDGLDSILLYFYGNGSTIIIHRPPSTSLGMEFDEYGNLFYQTTLGFYVLYKRRNWASGVIVSGSGAANGEYPSATSPPRFSGIQAFARVKDNAFAFGEAGPNFVVRSISIFPEMTIVPWSGPVNVVNIPVWNSTWMALISEAAREDLIALVGWSAGMYNGTAPFPNADPAALARITSSDVYTNSTSFQFEIPAFLANATTVANVANYSWPRVQAIVDAYYAPQVIILTIPAKGMPISPFSSPFATNNSAVAGVQYAVCEDLAYVTNFAPFDPSAPPPQLPNNNNSITNTNTSLFGILAAQYNISSIIFEGRPTDAVKVYLTIAGRLANNDTANALIGAYTYSLFKESAALAQNPPPPSSAAVPNGPTSITTLPPYPATSHVGLELQYLNGFRPFDLTLPNPMPPGTPNGMFWPTNNATAMKEVAAAVIAALGIATGTNAPPALDPSNLFGIYAANASHMQLGDGLAFSVGINNTIILHGTIKGNVDNVTTAAALISNLGSLTNYTKGEPRPEDYSQAAGTIADAIRSYNAPQDILIHFDASELPFANDTFMGPIMAAFNEDLRRYFANSTYGGACCVYGNTTSYEVLPGGIVALKGVIPGAYHNASTSEAFGNRNLHNSSQPLSPFALTLAAIEAAAAPRSVWLYFALEDIPPFSQHSTAANSPRAMNYPLLNASAIGQLLIGRGLAPDVAALIGIGEDKVILNRTEALLGNPKALNSVVSLGEPAFEVRIAPANDPSVPQRSKASIALHFMIPCAAYNDSTNAKFAANSAAANAAIAANGGDASAPAVSAATAAAYPRLEAQRVEYYATKQLNILFTPAGDFPLYSDPVPRNDVTPYTTYIYTAGPPNGSSSTTIAPIPTATTTTSPSGNGPDLTTSHMGVIYGLFVQDILRATRGNIDYPTAPNTVGSPIVPIAPVVEFSPDYDVVMVPINRTYVSRIAVRRHDGSEVSEEVRSYAVIDVPSVVLKATIPGPYYNESTMVALTPRGNSNLNAIYNNGGGVGSVGGPLGLSDGWLDASIFPSVAAYVSATTVVSVTFTPLGRWPRDNATRMFLLRQLLVEDAKDFFGYSGNYLNLTTLSATPEGGGSGGGGSGGAMANPTIVERVPATSTTPVKEGTITWRFNIPTICFPLLSGSNGKNLSTYSFPKTTQALDPNSDGRETTIWRGAAPNPTFFGDKCGRGCVIGIAVGCAALLAIIAVIVVIIASKRRRRSDVVSPNFDPGKIGIDLD